jgi:hypothetical protein
VQPPSLRLHPHLRQSPHRRWVERRSEQAVHSCDAAQGQSEM